MMCSVPPYTGLDVLAAEVDDVDDELHAASDEAASAAAASPAKHLCALIMGMFPLGQECKRMQGSRQRPRAVDHYLLTRDCALPAPESR